MTVPMESATREVKTAREAWTPNQPRVRRIVGKSFRNVRAEMEETTYRALGGSQ